MKPVLIAVLSPHGSTRETADHLARAFEAAGRTSEVRDLVPGLDLEPYSGVVVAAPVHGMRWLPEAVDFTAEHLDALRSRPVALVAVSYLYFAGRASWKAAIRRGLEAVRAPLPHASLQIFPGRLPSALPAPARWLFGVAKDQRLDLTDPAAAAAWAAEWIRTVP